MSYPPLFRPPDRAHSSYRLTLYPSTGQMAPLSPESVRCTGNPENPFTQTYTGYERRFTSSSTRDLSTPSFPGQGQTAFDDPVFEISSLSEDFRSNKIKQEDEEDVIQSFFSREDESIAGESTVRAYSISSELEPPRTNHVFSGVHPDRLAMIDSVENDPDIPERQKRTLDCTDDLEISHQAKRQRTAPKDLEKFNPTKLASDTTSGELNIYHQTLLEKLVAHAPLDVEAYRKETQSKYSCSSERVYDVKTQIKKEFPYAETLKDKMSLFHKLEKRKAERSNPVQKFIRSWTRNRTVRQLWINFEKVEKAKEEVAQYEIYQRDLVHDMVKQIIDDDGEALRTITHTLSTSKHRSDARVDIGKAQRLIRSLRMLNNHLPDNVLEDIKAAEEMVQEYSYRRHSSLIGSTRGINDKDIVFNHGENPVHHGVAVVASASGFRSTTVRHLPERTTSGRTRAYSI